MTGVIERVQDQIVKLLESEPDGLRHSDIVSRISAWDSSIPEGTIFGSIHTLPTDRPGDVYKPSRGLYRHTRFRPAAVATPPAATAQAAPTAATAVAPSPAEESLYAPFADYLVNDLEECTRAIALGGNRLGSKWGTPDVLGVLRPRESHIYKPPLELISAEIKTDPYQLIVAFGQACAYTLFSHRVYLVVPSNSAKEDIDRLTSLCQIFGLGLASADPAVTPPKFSIRLRAARHEPDSYYVNEVLSKLETELLH
jgi:hypothetical protein